MIPRHYLITGRPRVGKTTLLQHAAKKLGSRAGGFYTEEIKGEGVRGRRGFQLVTLEGKSGLMARVGDPTPYRLGRYGVHLEVVDSLGVQAIDRAVREKPWILIDEIGKMEEGSKNFRDAVWRALESPKHVLATIRLNDSPFTEKIKNRSDVRLIKLTVPNREEVYRELEEVLARHSEGP